MRGLLVLLVLSSPAHAVLIRASDYAVGTDLTFPIQAWLSSPSHTAMLTPM